MSAFEDVRAELVGKLLGGGVPATLNPHATPPFVLVGPPTVAAAAGIGGWSTTFPVWIVSPPPDNQAGLVWRLDQLERVYAALGFGPAYPDRWGERDAPAYLVTYPRTVSNPSC